MEEQNQQADEPQQGETIMVPEVGKVAVPPEDQVQASPTAVNDQITDSVTQSSSDAAPSSSEPAAPSTENTALSIQEEVTSTVTNVGSGEDAPATGTAPSYDALWNALENCRMLAAKRPKEDWARNILRFCSDVGVTANIMR